MPKKPGWEPYSKNYFDDQEFSDYLERNFGERFDPYAEPEEEEKEEEIPEFKNYAEVMEWITEHAKKCGSRQDFMATPLYRKALPRIEELWKAEHEGNFTPKSRG